MSLLSKLNDPDPDIRFMSLDDVLKNLTSPSSEFLAGDNITSARLVDGILKALDDQHGEVQNQALKWYVSSTSYRGVGWTPADHAILQCGPTRCQTPTRNAGSLDR